MVELLKRVLGEALVFFCIGQCDGGHALMPVATVDQRIEFCQRIFKVVEAADALCRFLPLFNGNFERHGPIAEAWEGYPLAVVYSMMLTAV